MHLEENKHYYIIEQRDGNIWRFFYKNSAGIVCSILDKNQWSEHKTVYQNAINNFCVLLGYNDEIQVLCQDVNGNIVSCSLHSDFWENTILIQRKAGDVGSVYFSAVQRQKNLHLFYMIPDRRSDRQAVIHQILYEGIKWSSPVIIDGIQPLSQEPFITCIDSFENIYIFYQTIDTENKLGYKKYLLDKEIWGNFNELSNTNIGYRDLSFLAAGKTFNLLYIKKEEDFSRLYYNCKDTLWRKPMELFKHEKIESCILFKQEDDLWAAWVCDNKIFSCSSCDNGHSFSTPTIYSFIDSYRPVKAFYRSNISGENNLCVNEIYVNDSSDKDFFILSDLLSGIINVEDHDSMILNMLDICSDSHLEHIKKHIAELNEKINKYKENIRTKNQQIYKMNEMIEEKSSFIVTLEAGVRKTSEKNRILAIENKSLVQKMEILQSSLEYKDSQILSGNVRLNSQQNEISNSMKEIEILRSKLEILKTELNRYTEKSKIPLIGRFLNKL